ncbi:glycolate oxidase subunit GlcE [Spiribacter vilamensis]|uniref:Glycolate oxidase FAD binding subunit n=1 Tax=Spiribacter vilamensis TaxID=531306 RepID=A0A4Q8D0M6_9GAMM|nr:glycolate oxidase subunit GlcE [Spiribacter vilamensis]RZU98787.1 glycolate oxidase FAD binding subunit [Spiribacter vilamensis]TVO62192.1 glycolate oxidase subunit GlcE [Spiribacter vilamensis]
MAGTNQTEELRGQVVAAAEQGEALSIIGGGSKQFYGNPVQGRVLDVSGHRGIITYEPTELVLTARAGTPIAEIEDALNAEGQRLAFEPPHFDGGATLGGAVAAGLAGPRRPYGGAVRDMVLGLRLINGRGELMRFGGEVMKNVAGYDVARLNTGALGTLGVITEVSLKVLPSPAARATLQLRAEPAQCHDLSEEWLRNGRPLSGMVHDGGALYARFEGTTSAVDDAMAAIEGEALEPAVADALWQSIRDHSHAFFAEGEAPLWRVSLPPASAPTSFGDHVFIDWSGQQLWLRSQPDPEALRAQAAAQGGSATLFRGRIEGVDAFPALDPVQSRLHRSIKRAFDPQGILNPGRLYSDVEMG